MAVKERLRTLSILERDEIDIVTYPPVDGRIDRAGVVKVEVINDNVVITVTREDEAKFGPVSLVVV